MEYSLKERREERENNNNHSNTDIKLLIITSKSKQDRGSCLRKELRRRNSRNYITRKNCYCPVPGTVTIGSSNLKQQLQQYHNINTTLSQPSSSVTTSLFLHGVTYLSLFWVTETTSATIIPSNSPFQPSLSHNNTLNKQQQHYNNHSFIRTCKCTKAIRTRTLIKLIQEERLD